MSEAMALETAVAHTAEQALERVAAVRAAIGASFSARRRWSNRRSSRCCRAAMACSSACRALPRRNSSKRSARCSASMRGACNSRRTSCPPIFSAPKSWKKAADHAAASASCAGPIFAQLLMADEINRASPRTQSALLQAMQEHHVSVAGERHDLPRPFHVLATQNPLEQEGTYPLPEAQLDRFLMQIDVAYPDRAAERRILIETTGDTDDEAKRR